MRRKGACHLSEPVTPVSQNVLVSIPGFNNNSAIFNQTLADGGNATITITITNANKGTFDTARTPTVQFGTNNSFTADNRPTVTV